MIQYAKKSKLNCTSSGQATPDGQRIMREGGESVRMWIGGVTLAPHRLKELLSEIGG